MKIIRLFFLFPLAVFSSTAKTQVLHIDLFQCIEIASDSSLQAFHAKNSYEAGYWEYRSYRASRLPSANLNLNPIQYNRNITQRY
ncbi:MAG: TolC family protein, partial [Dysgonamonadaceae bacterium]|nr:TolC family protein [Dysgonamonadaceae bacterium]